MEFLDIAKASRNVFQAAPRAVDVSTLMTDNIRTQYQGMKSALTGEPSPDKEWKNDNITSANGYNIPNHWTSIDLDQIVSYLRASIQSSTMNGTEAQLVLAGAAYLPKPGYNEWNNMLEDVSLGTVDLGFSPSETVLMATDSETITSSRACTPEEKENYKIELVKAQLGVSETETYLRVNSTKLTPDQIKSSMDSLSIWRDLVKNLSYCIENNVWIENTARPLPRVEKKYSFEALDIGERRFGVFICAFLFKILAKSPENIRSSWTAKTNRYINFYEMSSYKPSEWPTPSLEWVDTLKRQFSVDHVAKMSALKLINRMELQYCKEDVSEAGLVRYLFTTQLSYTGMHAYKLFCSCVHKLKKEPDWLLSNVHHPQFAPALSTIYRIYQNFEEGSENFNPAFRYARICGAQYFSQIQTKNCADLVFCFASIMEHYVEPNETYNPTNIKMCERLGVEVKARMKLLAENLIAAAEYTKESDSSGLVRDALSRPIASDNSRQNAALNTKMIQSVFEDLEGVKENDIFDDDEEDDE